MTSFDCGDIVVVPFPYTERDARYRRPSLVVSTKPIGDGGGLAWVLMITSSDNTPWPGDVPVGENYRAYGLISPSVVRTAKIANVEMSSFKRIGRLSDLALQQAFAEVRSILAL